MYLKPLITLPFAGPRLTSAAYVMGLQIFNSLTKAIEPFQPINGEGQPVSMYCCGPTVHNFAHIGNFRTFVFADLLRRYLRFRGYSIRHVMNITDVEDKIIASVQKASETLQTYTQRYEHAFLEDFKTLRCENPEFLPHATEHIQEIIDLIERLMQRGIAYRTPDSSVYFSIEKYIASGKKYGQLVNLNFEKMQRSERMAQDEYAKDSFADFALWKGRVAGDGAVFWPSPWGEGRPGWHIECSAMSMKLLGPSFDIHLGGEDLMFPHHEDEIAQSEGAELQSHGHPFVKYWMHGAHLLVEGKKMAKSLGNYFTVRDLLAKGFTGREIRYTLLSSHYRESFNFTLEGLTGGRTALQRIDEYLAKLRDRAAGMKAEPDAQLIAGFTSAMDQDLNVSAAWGGLFSTIREHNRLLSAGEISPTACAAILGAWERIDSVFAISAGSTEEVIDPDLTALLEARQAARKNKDFARADAIRDELKSKGWTIEDTPKGPKLKKL